MSVVLVVLLFGAAVVSAASGNPSAPVFDSVGSTAELYPWARVSVIAHPMNFGTFFGTFTGYADEEIIAVDNAILNVETNNAILNVETNCLLDLLFTAGDLTKGTSTIKTAYNVRQDGTDLGWLNRDYPGYSYAGPLSKSGGQLAATIKNYQMTGFAKLGPNVSSQEAGDYNATITLTVSAP